MYPNIGYVRIYGHFLKIEVLFLTKILCFLNICNIINIQRQYYQFLRQGHLSGFVTLPLSILQQALTFNTASLDLKDKIFNSRCSLNLYPATEKSSAKFLICYQFQRALKPIKFCEKIARVSNSLDPDETPSFSASHPDPSCLHMSLDLRQRLPRAKS